MLCGHDEKLAGVCSVREQDSSQNESIRARCECGTDTEDADVDRIS